jgi:RNA polymerase sigma factor (sigma-70 family)
MRGVDQRQTLQLLAYIAQGDLSHKIRHQLRAAHPRAKPEQVDDALQHAFVRAVGTCRRQSQGEVYVWLRTTAHRELLTTYRRAKRETPVQDAEQTGAFPANATVGVEDELAARDARARLHWLGQAIIARLSPRQRVIAALHAEGHTRREIATQVGVTERTAKRELERIMTAGRHELLRIAGSGCPDGETLIARTAFRLADADQARQAQLHLVDCRQCVGVYERLQAWSQDAGTSVLAQFPEA